MAKKGCGSNQILGNCVANGCPLNAISLGYCVGHYQRVHRRGKYQGWDSPTKTIGKKFLPVDERFFRNVTKTDTCWLWKTPIRAHGYGNFKKSKDEYVAAHRWSYEYHVGNIPEGLELDHLCRVRHCVNPAHLEPVTRFENQRRGMTVTAGNLSRTHCIRGHELPPKEGRKWRICKECIRIRSLEYHQKKKILKIYSRA